MKKIRLLFLLLFILGIYPSITLCEEINQDVYINIETPIYSVENTNTNIKFIAVNNGNNSFDGSLVYHIKGEGLQWTESKVNINIQPHNSSTVVGRFKPIYAGKYWITGSLKDANDNQITSEDYPINVNYLDAAAVIVAAMIALLAFLLKLMKN